MVNITLGNPSEGISNVTLDGDGKATITDNSARKEANLTFGMCSYWV